MGLDPTEFSPKARKAWEALTPGVEVEWGKTVLHTGKVVFRQADERIVDFMCSKLREAAYLAAEKDLDTFGPDAKGSAKINSVSRSSPSVLVRDHRAFRDGVHRYRWLRCTRVRVVEAAQ